MASGARKHDPSAGAFKVVQGGNPTAINALIHEPKRLAILSALSVNPQMSFNDLKAALETTDGNLSIHCKKLEEAGYLKVQKTFNGRVPRTNYKLNAAGKKAFKDYLDHLEAIIKQVRDV